MLKSLAGIERIHSSWNRTTVGAAEDYKGRSG